ncbi:MAG: ATP-binding cassette domain-containing protein [Candidatus Marinimicrobia bacterium]|nr:ATP-binding cassette domain-containing protein [Candidatus Neomarinimicrobiota bacterium]MBT3632428.1 ATP-binding cassette domain-containing protein [Candidatus Neomarinimicrobiota bacterium]MBT4130725.1 ATP-binding cassette domain-containing protein [Candidatus Neomarinimicrobiota bacterium]MBT4420263.1 ATP-binding cassette domain-containing protein [Candidatus Neomarinimicrobiota bacterium]MBT4992832.1 ATP-binding cassette domain-containing protein [Candidatus Neomarinimicrobiota bacterium
MLSTNNVSLTFGGQKLFEDVNIKFTPGNCYGLIGANGSGKSTFLKLLAGDIEMQKGNVSIGPGERMSVLKQDQFAYDEFTVLETVLKGNETLFNIMHEKDAIYMKPDFSDEDGMKAAELEAEFGEMGGWEAESEAMVLLAGLGLDVSYAERTMRDLKGSEKIKVLLAQAIFGTPDILLLDEPTNHLDIKAKDWLEQFLLSFTNTVVVVSHDRHFLNKVCTMTADIDFGKITTFAGNYDFWRQSSELAQNLRNNQNKKAEDKAKDLKAFISRFSANASKSKQATSRQKQLEKLELGDMPVSTRKYPYIHFEPKREAGKDILTVEGLTKTIEGKKVLDDVSFHIARGEKIIFLAENELATTTLFKILAGEMEADTGFARWGVTTAQSYFPKDNTEYFEPGKYNLIDWLRLYSEDQHEPYIRGLLGQMLFSGEDAFKKTNVLSGGERVRCMFAKMMVTGSNVLMFDGPTNHLDLESITAINEGLMRFKGNILFTSHDHEFNQTVSDRIIDLDVKSVEVNASSYDEYLGLH